MRSLWTAVEPAPPMSVRRNTVEPMVAALSPSRAADFMSCPMLYRFRAIDKLPSPPTQATARGTLVHAVLARPFDLPAPERTLAAAVAIVPREWERLTSEEPGRPDVLAAGAGRSEERFAGGPSPLG